MIGKADVVNLRFTDLIEEIGRHDISGQRLERERRNELRRGLAHHDVDLRAELHELADDLGALISCDRSSD